MSQSHDDTEGASVTDRFDGRSILFLYSSAHDRYLTHRTSVKAYAAAYESWGIAPQFLDLQNEDFGRIFLDALQSPDLLAVHCEQGWGLDLSLGEAAAEPDPYVTAGKPAIAHIRDYPFYPWLTGKTLAPTPNRLLHYTEATACDFARTYESPAPQKHHAFAPHIYLDEGTKAGEVAIPYADRPIDLLYVGSYTDPEKARQEFRSLHSDHAKVFDDLIEKACHDYHGVYWQHAESVFESQGLGVNANSNVFRDLLVHGNQFIRNERRRLLLAQLAPHPMHLVWSGDTPEVELHSDTIVSSGNTFPDTLELMARSKAMAMCLNNFPCSLSERFLSCMHLGTAVLCHGNTLIDPTFRDGDSFLRFSEKFDNAADLICQVDDQAYMEGLIDKAKRLAEKEFSPAIRIKQFLSAIDHFYTSEVV